MPTDEPRARAAGSAQQPQAVGSEMHGRAIGGEPQPRAVDSEPHAGVFGVRAEERTTGRDGDAATPSGASIPSGTPMPNGPSIPAAAAERERRALLVVAQEEAERAQAALTSVRDETARMTLEHARLRAQIDGLAAQVQAAQAEGVVPPGLQPTMMSLVQSYQVLGRSLEYQMGLVNELRAEWDRERRFALAARVILTDLTGSRVYKLMRLFGRWGSLERKIAKAFRT